MSQLENQKRSKPTSVSVQDDDGDIYEEYERCLEISGYIGSVFLYGLLLIISYIFFMGLYGVLEQTRIMLLKWFVN